jgi:antitoxin component of RelBE/YafQ-DinJ toxin-antitoxin module
MRVSPTARRLFAGIAERMGVSQTAAFETLIRRVAREEGLLPSHQPVDWSSHPQPTLDEFRQAMKEIEAMGPMSASGVSIPDEELTSDALYRDHE